MATPFCSENHLHFQPVAIGERIIRDCLKTVLGAILCGHSKAQGIQYICILFGCKACEKGSGIGSVRMKNRDAFCDTFFCVLRILQSVAVIQNLEGHFRVTFHKAILPMGIPRQKTIHLADHSGESVGLAGELLA